MRRRIWRRVNPVLRKKTLSGATPAGGYRFPVLLSLEVNFHMTRNSALAATAAADVVSATEPARLASKGATALIARAPCLLGAGRLNSLLSTLPAEIQAYHGSGHELGLELIQSHMAHKPVLRGEVGARALRVRLVSREEAWASAGVRGPLVSGCGCEAD